MVFNEAITTTTRNFIVPRVYDTITKGSPALLMLLQNAKSWKTGIKYSFPIKYQDTTNGGNVGIADKLDTDRQNNRTMLEFEVKMATKPVVVADIETTLNQGEEQIVDLLETEFDSQAQSISMLMAQNLFTGNGSGNSWDSLYEAGDDGTNFSTYGGKSKSTYTSLKGYYLASAGTTTLAKLATAYDAVTVGVDKPSAILTTKAIWSTYESLLTSTIRANYTTSGYPKMNAFGTVPSKEGLGAEQGFDVLYFRGAPIIKDEQIPSGRIHFLNQNYFGFKGVNIKGKNIKNLNFKKTNEGVPLGVVGRIPTTLGFNFRDLMNPVDQLAEVGHIIYAGNFISENPRTQGSMVGAS